MAALMVAALLIGSGTAWADYTMFGYGTKSCGSWTAEKEKDGVDRMLFHSWVDGYVTAYSRWVEAGSGPVQESDMEGAWAWIDEGLRLTRRRL